MTTAGFALRGVGLERDATQVLDELTLDLAPGRPTAIIGASGAGKSTLLRLLAGLDAPARGEILLDGAVVSRPGAVILPPHRRAVSMVFQDLALWPNLTVLGNVTFALSGTVRPARVRRERAAAALDLVGIGRFADRMPDSLSGGEQQRVALARALATAPRYLLLDEPFAGVDLPLKVRLRTEIRRLAHEGNITLVLVTHDPLDAVALCDHAVVLEGGRVADEGSLRAVLAAEQPSSETLRAFRAQLGMLRQLATPPPDGGDSR